MARPDQTSSDTLGSHAPSLSRIRSAIGVLAPHRYPQAEITQVLAQVMGIEGSTNSAVLARLHANSTVRQRNLALPLQEYPRLKDFTAANDAFIRTAVDLGADAVTQALHQAGLEPRDIDLLVSTTVTGLAVPSLDARLTARLNLRPDVKRIPIVGLGCVAGAAGIARLHDYLVGHPDHVAVLVSVELCSLTVQRDDLSAANLIASGLFGDGGAAVVMTGSNRAPRSDDGSPQICVVASCSRFYPETERAMGWDVGTTGLKIVLGVEVPALVGEHLAEDVDGFLADHGLDRSQIAWWVAHPGGPKVLEAMENALDLHQGELGVTWNSLADIGNLSSASVLHVLKNTLAQHRPPPDSWGLLLAMGPGFCAELVLLRCES